MLGRFSLLRQPGSLALPFAAVGLCGGLLLGAALPLWHDLGSLLAFLATAVAPAAVACLLVGHRVHQKFSQGRRWRALLALVVGSGIASFAYSAVCATTTAAMAWQGPVWFILGGVALTPSMVVALGPVALFRGAVGAKRPGSTVAAADARRTWLVTSFLVALAASAVFALPALPPGMMVLRILPQAMAVAALLALTWLGVEDTRALRALTAMTPRCEPLEGPEHLPTPPVDLGIGDQIWVLREPARPLPYRDSPRDTLRGSLVETARHLRRSVLIDCVLFALALLSFVAAASRHLRDAPTGPAPRPLSPNAEPLPVSSATTDSNAESDVRNPPILFDVNGDGREDIVSFRRDSDGRYRFAAQDGTSFAILWQSDWVAITDEQAVNIERSGDRLYLGSQNDLSTYDLQTGRKLDTRPMPERAFLACADAAATSGPRAWLWLVGGAADGGYAFDGATMQRGSEPPSWCISPWPSEVTLRMVNRFSLVLAPDGTGAVAVGRSAMPRDLVLLGFHSPAPARDAAGTWAQHGELYDKCDEPEFGQCHIVTVAGGRVFLAYLSRARSWKLAAFDARSGNPLWQLELAELSDPRSVTGGRQSLYIEDEGHLRVLDAATGAFRGNAW